MNRHRRQVTTAVVAIMPGLFISHDVDICTTKRRLTSVPTRLRPSSAAITTTYKAAFAQAARFLFH